MHKWIFSILGLMLITSCVPLENQETAISEPRPSFVPENTPTLIPTVNAELPGYTSTSLEIIRNGKKYSVLLGYQTGEAFWRVTPHPDINMSNWYGDVRQTRSANLEWYGDFDNDGETEYLVSSYALGNTLYISILAIDYDKPNDEYRIFDEIGFRAPCFERWDDIEKDGIPEIVGKDEGYHYASGGGGADSVFSPIKIFRYNGQEFISVTQEYPDLIEQDAQHWLEAIDNDAWGQGQFGTIYASYLADMYLLGKQEEGIKVFSELCTSRFIPYVKDINPESTLNCDEFLIRVKNALIESGYDNWEPPNPNSTTIRLRLGVSSAKIPD